MELLLENINIPYHSWYRGDEIDTTLRAGIAKNNRAALLNQLLCAKVGAKPKIIQMWDMVT